MSKFTVTVSENGCGGLVSVYEAKTKLEAMKEAMDFYRMMFEVEAGVELVATAKVVRS